MTPAFWLRRGSRFFLLMKVLYWIIPVIFICSAVYTQKVLVDRRFSFILNNPDCEWCLETDAPDRVDFIPHKTIFLRLAAPADSGFLADVLWLRASYHFGVHAITDGIYPYLDFLLQRITDLSPKWDLPYWAGAVMLLFEARDPIKAMALLDKGMDNLPELWELPFLKGYIFWKQFNNFQAASLFFHRASKLPGAPVYLSDLSRRMDTKRGQKRADDIFSGMVDKKLADPLQNERIHKRIEEM